MQIYTKGLQSSSEMKINNNIGDKKEHLNRDERVNGFGGY